MKRFTFNNAFPSTLSNIIISSYFPQLEVLTLHVKKFPRGAQLGSWLSTTIQELYLRNDDGGPLPQMPANVDLPQLRVLGITYPGFYLLDKLTARALQSLILYGTKRSTSLQMVIFHPATSVYGQLFHLTFEDWQYRTDHLAAVAVFKKLVEKTLAVQTVKFITSFVNGRDLVSGMKTIVAGSGESASHKQLEEITLSYTSGITNDQCDELKKLVKRVKIYM